MNNILVYDIETSPIKCYTWTLTPNYIFPVQILEDSYVISWAAKWLDSNNIEQDHVENKADKKRVVENLHKLLDEADITVTFNGNKFDSKVMNTSFVKYGLEPPFPSKNVDLYKVARNRFRFSSNKLDYICQQLGLPTKTEHSGFDLWKKYLDGDEEAINTMLSYNVNDVLITEELYYKLRPWVKNHPNVVESEDVHCAACGSTNLIKKGVETVTTGKYQRYRCKDCGSPSRGRTMINTQEERKKIVSSI